MMVNGSCHCHNQHCKIGYNIGFSESNVFHEFAFFDACQCTMDEEPESIQSMDNVSAVLNDISSVVTRLELQNYISDGISSRIDQLRFLSGSLTRGGGVWSQKLKDGLDVLMAELRDSMEKLRNEHEVLKGLVKDLSMRCANILGEVKNTE